MSEENTSLNSWDAFTGNFLKAEDVKSEEDIYVCIGASPEEFDGKIRLRLTLERNEIRKDFTLNMTNVDKIRELGFEKPRDVIGCKILFSKIKTQNPTTRKEVDALRIKSVEE